MELDINSICLIISVLLAIIFSTNAVKSIIHKVTVVLAGMENYYAEIEAKQLLMKNSQQTTSKVEIQDTADSICASYSRLSRSLECNISLFFWCSIFGAGLLFFEDHFDQITTAKLVAIQFYVCSVPYFFLIIWSSLDSYFARFRVDVLNNKTSMRYPLICIVTIITTLFWDVDFILNGNGSNKSIVSIMLGAGGSVVGILILSYLIVKTNRILVVETHEIPAIIERDSTVPPDEVIRLYSKGALTEAVALVLSCTLSIILAKYIFIYLDMPARLNIGFQESILLMPFLCIAALLVALIRWVPFKVIFKFFFPTPLV